jgi:hypothetical protein
MSREKDPYTLDEQEQNPHILDEQDRILVLFKSRNRILIILMSRYSMYMGSLFYSGAGTGSYVLQEHKKNP